MSNGVTYNDMPVQADHAVEPAIDDGRSSVDAGVVAPVDSAPPEPAKPDKNELEDVSANRLDEIYANARAQRAIDEKPEEPAQEPASIEAGQEETPPAQQMPPAYRITVDGVDRVVSVDDLVRNYQIDQAAHKRMQEASLIKAEAQRFLEMAAARAAQPTVKDETSARPNGAPAPTNPTQQGPTALAGVSDKELMEAAEQIQLGTAEQGANALRTLLSKAAPPPMPAQPVDISREVASAIATQRDNQMSTGAMEQFFGRFPALAEDEIAHGALVNASRAEMLRDFSSKGVPADALRDVDPDTFAEMHRQARLRGVPGIRQPWQILEAVAQNPRFQHFATGPGARNVQVDIDRGQRKQEVQPQPALRTATPPRPAQPESVSADERNAAVVAQMRKDRGLSAYS